MIESSSVLSLKSVYLQLRVDKKSWKYQTVHYKGMTYFLQELMLG